MKKYLIFILLILLTGCYNINEKSLDSISDHVLSKKVKANTALKGYKLYLSKDMTLVGDRNSNNIILSEKDKYYLYVDLISYYNNAGNIYKIKSEEGAYFIKTLEYDDKIGYIIITQEDDEYFIEVLYNYAKIEVRTDNVKKSLYKALLVLNSIEFNDNVIESLIGKNVIDYDEEVFNLKGPSSKKVDAFLEYDEKYGEYVDTKDELPDEDIKNFDNQEVEHEIIG